MNTSSSSRTAVKPLLVILGLTLVSVAVLPFIGVAIETAKPENRFPGLDRFIAFDGILYMLSGLFSSLAVWAMLRKRHATPAPWAAMLAGIVVLVLVPLLLIWVLPASIEPFFLIYALVTVPTMLGAYLVSSVALLNRSRKSSIVPMA